MSGRHPEPSLDQIATQLEHLILTNGDHVKLTYQTDRTSREHQIAWHPGQNAIYERRASGGQAQVQRIEVRRTDEGLHHEGPGLSREFEKALRTASLHPNEWISVG